MRKICVVTATRAEYGLLKPLMSMIQASEELELQIVATGAHLSPEFGLTYKLIENDGFIISEKIEILMSSDTPPGLVKTMGVAMISFADAFKRINPDLLVILGDRYEMLSVASAATIFRIPIAHIHGGEITEGAYDDAIRHSITKMSHIHFASTLEYRNRIIQMGEQPDTVHHVGAIGLDNIRSIKLMTKGELEKSLDVRFNKYNYQVTFHPETLGELNSEEQFQILLDVIDKQEESFFVFTKANADTDGRIINQMIDDFVVKNPNKAKAFHSLGAHRFLSLIHYCDAIVGNSSSGILEAPSLFTPTINIGDRQKGRTQAASTINVQCTFSEIERAFFDIKEKSFVEGLKNIVNPYDNGGAANKIYHTLINSKNIDTHKSFYNL